MLINGAGEGFLRDLRVTVFDHLHAPVDGVLRPGEGRRARLPHDADVESMGELVQFGLLQFVSAALLLVFTLVLLL